MQLYAISDRRALGSSEEERCSKLVSLAARWAQGGVDYIQIREKDMDAAALEVLGRSVVEAVRAAGNAPSSRPPTKVLVNGSPSIALEAGADGVHLPGSFDRQTTEEVRCAFAPEGAVVSVACHSLADVERATNGGADLILFAPVFGKVGVGASAPVPGAGLGALRAACHAAGGVPVFALGGVDAENASDCIDAGAAGIAGIRLFAGEDWTRIPL